MSPRLLQRVGRKGAEPPRCLDGAPGGSGQPSKLFQDPYPPTAVAGESATEPEARPEMQLALPEPMMIELVSEPPRPAPDTSATETGLA